MVSNFYLIVNKKGILRVTKTQPSLNWDEISISMCLQLPDKLFQKPFLSANIIVGDDKINPTVITPEIKNEISNAIKQHSGIEVKLNIVENEKN